MRSSKNKSSSLFAQVHPSIELKNSSEIEKLRNVGKVAADILNKLSQNIKPGVSTQQLDEMAFKSISSLGMKPAFLGYRGFPSSICASINNELVHGIPRTDKVIKESDIISIDLGLISHGFYGDTAATFAVGKISSQAQQLLEVTKEALNRAIEQVKPGNRIGDLSWAIQNIAEESDFSVIRDYVGHGIGRKLHEEPAVPNFGKPHTGIRLIPGMVIAIEPMIAVGDYQVKILTDGWTVVTVDGKLCAHFEHMVAVTENGNEVLTEI